MNIMGIKSINAISNHNDYGNISKTKSNNNKTFESFFQSALDNVNETNSYIQRQRKKKSSLP